MARKFVVTICPSCKSEIDEKYSDRRSAVLEMIRTRPTLGYRDIASIFCLNPMTVASYAREAGIKRGNANRSLIKRATPKDKVPYCPRCPHCGAVLPDQKLGLAAAVIRTAELHPDLTYRQIGELYHVSMQTVTNYMRRARKRRYAHIAITPGLKEVVLDLIRNEPECTYTAIAEKYHLHVNTVPKWARNADLRRSNWTT